MKNLALALLVTVAGFASARSIAPWEQPIMSASLEHFDGPTFPRAMSLTMKRRQGSEDPTSFTLVEDTGIRCIVAPCPSQKKTNFRIEEIDEQGGRFGVVTYTAYEILKNVPPHVRMAGRRLTVQESTTELVVPGGNGFMTKTIWVVTIDSFGTRQQRYQGEARFVNP